ncbi:innexin inx2 isoform X1 [Lepeophtheirus salmonis]|uniref:Innexin n=2 Tax=Lepeophtheirus salmonis TaxID=72036 RepID=A0A0K2TDD4_LEPSM|nr:innexin inx2-like [Lepeophtheirus salmonis]
MAAAIGIAKTATEIFLGVGEVSIDNFTFKLYYKWTVTMFIVSSVLVSTSQFFGEPIQCETAEDSIDDDVLNAFCWMYSSFDMPSSYTGSCARKRVDSTHLYNTYYQWVSIFLVAQAMLFYIPRCIWILQEGGLMGYLVKGTTGRVVENADEKKGNLLRNFQIHIHNKFSAYAFCFFFCELLNVILVIFAIFITHKFLNNQFLTYGLDVYLYFSLPPEERIRQETVNPMCEVFPKIAACDFHRYGMGGGMDNRFGICVLGLNMINDKVFVFIWYWYCLLIILGVIRIISRTSQIASSKVRYFLMKIKMNAYFGKHNHHMRHIQHYVLNCSIGDWFVLYQMSKNLNKRFFAEFIALTAMIVNPDPNIAPEEPEIFFSDEEIFRIKNFSSTEVSKDSDTKNGDEEEEGAEEEEEESSKPSNPFAKVEGDIEEASGASCLTGKQRMLIKNGKGAISAKHKAMVANAQVRRLKRR